MNIGFQMLNLDRFIGNRKRDLHSLRPVSDSMLMKDS